MRLTGSQREQICNAILAGYDESGLKRLVEYSLEQRLDHIARGDNLTDEVTALVRWAERNGYVEELVQAAHDRNPKNPELQQLQQDFSGWAQDSSGAERLDSASMQAGSKRSRRWPVLAVALLGLLLVGAVWASNWLGQPNQEGALQPNETTATTATQSTLSATGASATEPSEAAAATMPSEPVAADPATAEPADIESVEIEPVEIEPMEIEPVEIESEAETAAIEFDLAADMNQIRLGQTATGELVFDEPNEWIFADGPAMIDLLLDTGPRSEAFILILDIDGQTLHDVDAQSGPEERLVNYEIPDEQPYTIAIRNLKNAPAQYTLAVTESAPPQLLTLNDSVHSAFYGNEGIPWLFDRGPAKISLTLTLARDGDASISIFDEGGQLIQYANNQPGAEERIANFDIPDTQTYTIILRNEANQPADYTFTLDGRQ